MPLNSSPRELFIITVNAVSFKSCSFTWSGGSLADDKPTLEDLTLNIKHGELVAVVGVVGAGKSSIISALLGDMTKLQGHVCVSVCSSV